MSLLYVSSELFCDVSLSLAREQLGSAGFEYGMEKEGVGR